MAVLRLGLVNISWIGLDSGLGVVKGPMLGLGLWPVGEHLLVLVEGTAFDLCWYQEGSNITFERCLAKALCRWINITWFKSSCPEYFVGLFFCECINYKYNSLFSVSKMTIFCGFTRIIPASLMSLKFLSGYVNLPHF